MPGKGRNWRLFCALCGNELPYQRVMEQAVQSGHMRYIEEEVGLICGVCLDALPDAKPPELRAPEPVAATERHVFEPDEQPSPWPKRRGW